MQYFDSISDGNVLISVKIRKYYWDLMFFYKY